MAQHSPLAHSQAHMEFWASEYQQNTMRHLRDQGQTETFNNDV